jgi:TonB family protein
VRLTISRCVFAALASILITSTALAENALEQAAASTWQNHVYTLRSWVGGGDIETDEHGQVLHNGGPVSWTQARFEVQKVTLHHDKIEFRGNRVGMLYDKDKRQLVNVRLLPLRLVMRIDTSKLQPNDLAQITDSLFITDLSQLIEALPEFWKSFATGKVKSGSNGKKGQFYFLPDEPDDGRKTPAKIEPIGTTADGEQIFHLTAGITPPAALKTPDPVYDDLARKMHVAGQDVLAAVIGADGTVREVQIARPIGMGLDERAVQAVRGWLFRPATRDGKPVAVQINIEVNFRLY